MSGHMDLRHKANRVASRLQLLTLEYLVNEFEKFDDPVVLHGGTSLNVAWGSPRFSEDLDFMVSEKYRDEFDLIMKTLNTKMQKRVDEFIPGMKLTAKGKFRKPRLGGYWVSVQDQNDKSLASIRVKVEPYLVNPVVFQKYQVTGRNLEAGNFSDHIQVKMDVGDLSAVSIDKTRALAFRPFVKARDLFDVWWIHENHPDKVPGPEEIVDTILEQNALNLYQDNDMTTFWARVRAFQDISDVQMLDLLKKDLQPFFTDSGQWQWLIDNCKLPEIVDTARRFIGASAEAAIKQVRGISLNEDARLAPIV